MPIYLLRHGESEHNVAMKRFMNHNPDKAGLEWWEIEDAFDPGIRDAELTDIGVQQAIAQQATIEVLDPTLLVLSPLSRNLKTGAIACGSIRARNNPLNVLVTPLMREHTYSTCDIGSSPTTLAEAWPLWSGQLSSVPEFWWAHDLSNVSETDKNIYREPWQKLQRRVTELVRLLSELSSEHRSIVVVGHAVLFYALTGEWMANCQLVELDLGKLRPHCECTGFACRCEMEFDCKRHT